MTYKYVKTISTLTNNNHKNSLQECLMQISELVQVLQQNHQTISKFAIPNTIGPGPKRSDSFYWNKIQTYDDPDDSVTAANKKEENKIKMADSILAICKDICANIKFYYTGWPEKYWQEIRAMDELNEQEYEVRFSSCRYLEKLNNCSQISAKFNALNAFIRNYILVKDEYLVSDDGEFGLIGFFKKNKFTLERVYTFCLQNICDLNLPGSEINSEGRIAKNVSGGSSREGSEEEDSPYWEDENGEKMEMKISKNRLMENFWIRPEVYLYFEVMEL